MKFFDKKSSKRGALTLEYIILVTGVVTVLVLFIRPSGPLSVAINSTYQTAANGMFDMGMRLGARTGVTSGVSSGIMTGRFEIP